MRLLVVAMLVAALAFAGFRLTEKRAGERRLASIASEIADREVAVRCQGPIGELVDVNDEYGFVRFGAQGRPIGAARLDREICVSLARLARGERVSVADGSLAVEALAHESYHLAGVQDEAAAQCYALQAMRFVASRLGLSEEVGEAYVAEAVARYPRLRELYRSEDCREGGALDLRPETGVFP